MVDVTIGMIGGNDGLRFAVAILGDQPMNISRFTLRTSRTLQNRDLEEKARVARPLHTIEETLGKT